MKIHLEAPAPAEQIPVFQQSIKTLKRNPPRPGAPTRAAQRATLHQGDLFLTSSRDGSTGKHSPCLLPQPHQNYN